MSKEPQKPSKVTRNQRAADIGITVQCLANWERCGVDVWDDEAIRRKLSRVRNLPPNLNPDFAPKVANLGEIDENADPSEVDIELLVKQLADCQDKHQAQTIKLKIDGLLNAFKLREAAGKYVSRAVVKESLLRIGAVFKASTKRFEADLPPMLDGASPETMKRIIGEKIDDMLRTLEEEYHKAYNAESQPD